MARLIGLLRSYIVKGFGSPLLRLRRNIGDLINPIRTYQDQARIHAAHDLVELGTFRAMARDLVLLLDGPRDILRALRELVYLSVRSVNDREPLLIPYHFSVALGYVFSAAIKLILLPITLISVLITRPIASLFYAAFEYQILKNWIIHSDNRVTIRDVERLIELAKSPSRRNELTAIIDTWLTSLPHEKINEQFGLYDSIMFKLIRENKAAQAIGLISRYRWPRVQFSWMLEQLAKVDDSYKDQHYQAVIRQYIIPQLVEMSSSKQNHTLPRDAVNTVLLDLLKHVRGHRQTEQDLNALSQGPIEKLMTQMLIWHLTDDPGDNPMPVADLHIESWKFAQELNNICQAGRSQVNPARLREFLQAQYGKNPNQREDFLKKVCATLFRCDWDDLTKAHPNSVTIKLLLDAGEIEYEELAYHAEYFLADKSTLLLGALRPSVIAEDKTKPPACRSERPRSDSIGRDDVAALASERKKATRQLSDSAPSQAESPEQKTGPVKRNG